MEIPEISMISDFQAGVKCLQDPSTVGRFFAVSGMELYLKMFSFWKWGAVILAILATFSGVIRRVKLMLIRFQGTVKPSVEQFVQHFADDFELTDDDDEDGGDDCSSISSMEDYDDDEGVEPTMSFGEDQWRVDRDFRVAGGDFYAKERWQNGNNLRLRRRLSWSDFSTGKSVVKLWDSLGLGFDFEESCKSVVSMWDLNRNQKISDLFGGAGKFPGVAGVVAPSQKVVFSADVNGDGTGVVLGGYDARMRSGKPAMCAEWGSPAVAGKMLGMRKNGAEKVYVRDEAAGVLTVGDMRNLKTPLMTVKVTESDGDTWWDADGVAVEDDMFNGER